MYAKLSGLDINYSITQVVRMGINKHLCDKLCPNKHLAYIAIGYITVVKTLKLPVLNHLIITLQNPYQELVKHINELVYAFIWNSFAHKSKERTVTQGLHWRWIQNAQP